MNRDAGESEMDLLHLVFAVVAARTNIAALAKGSAAHSFLVKKGDTAVHECELVAESDGSPSRTLTNDWGNLPDVAHVESDAGQRLLQQACDRTRWRDNEDSTEHATYLYDDAGHAIDSRQRLAVVHAQAEDALWLVPALALQQRPDEQGQPSSATPTHKPLHCRHCERETPHRFRGAETSPDEQWAGQPIWECRICETPRHGPSSP
ncbi:hypothetical protein [Halarchaeum nitratireducens]|uniref:DUF7995 domain-containing protein n=1 Tax=Halarchaeum nitratireducens TaxID=489913 RepID=A0A830GDS7_9EURY|nr:hypothetical protein [Halarchaeum nitratireducens]GGN24983.1 hypothetical protein GCM10009021_28580 [Halarchaeum nitratireducens]